MSREALAFSFHGVGVRVESEDREALQTAAHDFSWFSVPENRSPCRLRLVVRRAKPDYDSLPVMSASLATPRNICYRHGGRTYIDYFGRALNVYDPAEGTAHIFTEDEHLSREIVYLTILSRVSDALDRKRLHRIHALGIEHRGRGVLVLLPSGGGKSTLALSLLRDPGARFRLISEDSPLVGPDGMLHPFPLRIGVHPHSLPPGIDGRFTRVERRMEFDPKVSIDVRYFADRIVDGPVRPAAVLLGTRTTATTASLTPAPRRAMVRHALMNSVVGVGLYQGMEFILQRGLRDLVGHGSLALSRALNNLRLARRARVWRFHIGRDPSANFEALAHFLESTAGEGP